MMLDEDRVIMSGSTDDIAKVQGLRKHGEKLFWIRTGKTEYVVRDAKVIAELEAAWRPQQELSKKMGALGGQMGTIGQKIGALGSAQGAAAMRQANLSMKRAQLQMRLSQLQRRDDRGQLSSAERAELEEEREQLTRKLAKLEAKRASVAVDDGVRVEMEDLKRELERYSKDMKAMSAQHEALMKKVEVKVNGIVDRAIASGIATPV